MKESKSKIIILISLVFSAILSLFLSSFINAIYVKSSSLSIIIIFVLFFLFFHFIFKKILFTSTGITPEIKDESNPIKKSIELFSWSAYLLVSIIITFLIILLYSGFGWGGNMENYEYAISFTPLILFFILFIFRYKRYAVDNKRSHKVISYLFKWILFTGITFILLIVIGRYFYL